MPPFAQFTGEGLEGALERAIARRREEVRAIARNPQPPSFTNTVEALEEGGLRLDVLASTYKVLSASGTAPRVRGMERRVGAALAALDDAIWQDQALLARVDRLWQERAALGLDREQAALLAHTRSELRRAGAPLPAGPRARLREINQELTRLSAEFGRNLAAENDALRLVIDDEREALALPERLARAGAAAARAAGLDGWLFTLERPSVQAVIGEARDRELRRRGYLAYHERAAHGGPRDNRPIAARIAALRAERAVLLGYASHAELVLERSMAGSVARVHALLDGLWHPALIAAGARESEIEASFDDEAFELEPWDWQFYARQKTRRVPDVREYFALESVLEGAFDVVHRLYGISFIARDDIPVYHPDVLAFEVRDRDGGHLGVFLADYVDRQGKRSGAWTREIRTACRPGGRELRPVIVNIASLVPPAGRGRALLTPRQVRTLYHELGHAVHSLLIDVRYRSLAAVPRDFVELPSQMLENWAFEPEVLRRYARHVETGRPLPARLALALADEAASDHGYRTLAEVASARLDLDWHGLTEPIVHDAAVFEAASLTRGGLPRAVSPAHRTASFQLVFAAGYSAAYYSYLWSEMLDADAFALFRARGLFDRETAAAFRRELLEPGGSVDLTAAWDRFRGRPPSLAPLLERRGLATAQLDHRRVSATGQSPQ